MVNTLYAYQKEKKKKKKTMLILNHILEVLFKQIKEICVYFLLIFYLCSSTK